MDIKLLSECCAKIVVSAEECRNLGIDYQSFSPDNTTAQLFLASILARLERMGTVSAKSDKITAEIFEQQDESLVIYISGKGLVNTKSRCEKQKESAVFCRTPQEVISTVKRLSEDASSFLYKCDDKYAIISDDIGLSSGVSAVEIAKIKEYWTLLSDTPKDQLFDL